MSSPIILLAGPSILAIIFITTTHLLTNHNRRPLSWHRRRRAVLRTLAGGAMLR